MNSTNDILNNFALQDKTILVTGASSGIGRQIALHAAALGANVYITGRTPNKLEETSNLLFDKNHKSIVADLTNTEDISRLTETIEEKLDGIVHCAGTLFAYPAKYITEEQLQQVFGINYFAPVKIMTSLFRKKKINRNCSVVFISTFSTQYPYATGSLYTSSKAALENYAKSLAVENAESGLRANAILPAMVNTDIYNTSMESHALKDRAERIRRYESFYLKGIGQPKDVANMTTFLLSDASTWITGQSFVIDGGYLLGLTSKLLD